MKQLYKSLLAVSLLTTAGSLIAQTVSPVDSHDANVRRALEPRPSKGHKVAAKLPAFGDPNEIITEAPSGVVKQYVREGYFWYPYYGYMLFDHKENCNAEIVEGDDGFVYLKNPYTDFVSNSYLKGKREGDKIKVSLPQPIYQEPNMVEPGKINTYYAVIMIEEYAGSDYYAVTDATEVTYSVDGDKISLDLGYIPQMDPWGGWEYPYYILGLVTDEGIWMSEGEAAQIWTPFTGKTVDVPADLHFEDWAMKFNDGGIFAKVGFDGDDVYVKGMMPELADGVFKGHIDGSKIVFPSGQYLGVYNSDTYAYMVGVTYDEDGNATYDDNVTFDFDRDAKVFNAGNGDGIAFSKNEDSLSVIKVWRSPAFCLQPDDIDLTPLAPSFIEYKEFSDETGEGFFRFNLPILNKDGYVLNDANMYYNVFFDGELETFYTDEYTRLEYDMTDIPYTFGEKWNFYALGTVHVLYYYSRGVKTAGIRLSNKVDGEVYSSPTTTLDLATGQVTSGADAIESDSTVVAEEWYALDGTRVAEPCSGIYVQKTVLANGDVVVKKVARK